MTTAATASSGAGQEAQQQSVPALTIAALGVVFGDIGTSPLYALKEGMSPAHGIPLTEASVYGVLSLIVWTLMLVVDVASPFRLTALQV